MKKIRVNTGSLQTTQNEVNAYLKNLQSEIQNLQDSVTKMEAMWSGDAAKAFHQRITADIRTATQLNQSLKSIATFEGEAKKEYDGCEQKVSQMISSIRI